jgi:RNA polymerase sigma-70 factor (ECF subfamily)
MRSRQASADQGQAWVSLFDRGLREVYGYLLHRCGNQALAQDLTSETMLTVARTVKAGHDAELSVGWLITVARNKLIDHWRRTAVEERALRAVAGEWTDTAWGAFELEPGVAVEVLHRLAAQHRAVLTLRYLDGLSLAETARLLGRTEQATQALLARAKNEFRDKYVTAEGSDSDV